MNRNMRNIKQRKELMTSLTAGKSFKTAFFAYLAVITLDLLMIVAFFGLLYFIFGN